MKKLSLIAVSAVSLLFTDNALAAGHENSPDIYVGGGVMSSKATDFCDNAANASAEIDGVLVVVNSVNKCEDTEVGYKIFGGLRATENTGVEFGYMAADGFAVNAQASTSVSGLLTTKSEVSTFYLAAVGYIPLQENLSFMGKLGVHRWDAELSGNFDAAGTANDGSAKLKDDGTDFMMGLGAQYDFHDYPFSVRGEYEYLSVDEDLLDKMHVFSLNLLFRI